MKKSLFYLFLFVSFSLFAQNTYLHCGKVIDTESGKILTNKTIIVSGKTIQSIEDGFVNPANSEDITVDLKSKTVMPGLIDMHVHIEHETNPKRYLEKYILNDADVAFNAVNFAKVTLDAGFTTVRDLGGSGVNIALRKAIASGKIEGPRIFTAGKSLATTGGHADPTNGSNKRFIGDPGPKEGVGK